MVLDFQKSTFKPSPETGISGHNPRHCLGKSDSPPGKCLRAQVGLLKTLIHFCMKVLGKMVASFKAVSFAQFPSRKGRNPRPTFDLGDLVSTGEVVAYQHLGTEGDCLTLPTCLGLLMGFPVCV